jgi:uncharacterized membrane protein
MGVLVMLRYVLPGGLVVAGIVALVAADDSVKYDFFGTCWGAAFALAVFAQLIRLNTGDADDRDREAAAREYYTEHGRWPDNDESE